MGTFEEYAIKIDEEVSKLPVLKTWLSQEYVNGDKCETDDLEGFMDRLKTLLEYLQAKDIFSSSWHQYATQVEFKPCGSPYFRMDAIGKANELTADGNLTGVIAIGFDEELDYEEKDWNLKPSLILWYEYGKMRGECTDVYLFNATDWRTAVNEFFDIQKTVNPPKYIETAGKEHKPRNTRQLKLTV